MMESDEDVQFFTIEIVRLGSCEGVTTYERGIRVDANGIPVWNHAYSVIDNWLYARGIDVYTPLYKPIQSNNGGWVTHSITRDGETVRFVRIMPPARGVGGRLKPPPVD